LYLLIDFINLKTDSNWDAWIRASNLLRISEEEMKHSTDISEIGVKTQT
jgi:hypothetical protein